MATWQRHPTVSQGRLYTMITIHVRKRYGASTVRWSVMAPSIEQALKLAGDGAGVVCPIDGEAYFASAKANS